jgi:alginate O-acetyltransferase complex protein AlgI
MKGMFDIHVLNATAATAYLKQNIIFYIVAVILCIPIRRYLDGKSRKASPAVATVYNVLYGFVLAAGFILSVTYIFNNAYNPFIYFNF